MWIFLNDAMLSIVEGDNGMLSVRARIEGDIERVFPEALVQVSPERDYRYRTALPRSRVVTAMAFAVNSINYTNFKNSIADNYRHDAYLEVWEAMRREQQARVGGPYGDDG